MALTLQEATGSGVDSKARGYGVPERAVNNVRTKQVEGVLRLDVCQMEPRVELALAYDGLAGIGQRPFLRDIVDELARKGPKELKAVLDRLRARRSGQVFVYFSDYVSYGVGGGDATSEFYLGSFLILHWPARPAGEGPAVPEHLELQRPGGRERLSLEGLND